MELKFRTLRADEIEVRPARIDKQSGKAINPMIALQQFGCFRLGARIWDLRNEGMNISTRMVDNGKGAAYAEYRIQ